MTPRVVHDPEELVELYRRDTPNHIYALADLEEPYWSMSTWWRRGDAALGLVGLPGGSTIVYAVSSADPTGTLELGRDLVDQIPPTLITGVRGLADVFEAAGRTLAWQRGYHRFHLTNRNMVPDQRADVVALGSSDVDEMQALYDTDPGAAFFNPYMVDDDTFVGVRVDGELIAVAGTHVLSEHHGVAAVGAVFTHVDHRGAGHGAAVTAGVIHRIGDRVGTIGLNTTDTNASARHIYQRLGFTEALAYEECELA